MESMQMQCSNWDAIYDRQAPFLDMAMTYLFGCSSWDFLVFLLLFPYAFQYSIQHGPSW